MTRLLRLSCLSVLMLSALALGCGTATTLPDVDSGVMIPDTGGPGRDTGLTVIGDTGPRTDTGMIMFMRDGGPRPDTGTMGGGSDAGTTMGVMCGAAVCSGTDVCCVTRPAGGMMINTACSTAAACNANMGAPLMCDGPEDCTGGQACCGAFAGGMASASCSDPSVCAAYGTLCHTMADCPGTQMCRAFMGLSACSPF